MGVGSLGTESCYKTGFLVVSLFGAGGHPRGDNAETVAVAAAVAEQVMTNAPPAGVTPADLQAMCAAMSTSHVPLSPWFCGRPTGVIQFGDLSYAVGVASEWEVRALSLPLR